MTNKLVKATNTGENLSGWKIGLFTDSACTKAVPGSPFTTGEDGTISVHRDGGSHVGKC